VLSEGEDEKLVGYLFLFRGSRPMGTPYCLYMPLCAYHFLTTEQYPEFPQIISLLAAPALVFLVSCN